MIIILAVIAVGFGVFLNQYAELPSIFFNIYNIMILVGIFYEFTYHHIRLKPVDAKKDEYLPDLFKLIMFACAIGIAITAILIFLT